MSPMDMGTDGREVHSHTMPYPSVTGDVYLDMGTQEADVMHPNSISYLARLGYSHGLLGMSPQMSTPRYDMGYAHGVAQWNAYMRIARGE